MLDTALVVLIAIEASVVVMSLRYSGNIDFNSGDHSPGLPTGEAVWIGLLGLVVTILLLVARLNWPKVKGSFRTDLDHVREARRWFQQHGPIS